MNLAWSNSPWCRRALAVVAGAGLALSFHKADVSGLAWVAPALMLLAARGANAFRLGWLAGFTHYLVSLSWLLHIPVNFYPILGWLALAAYLALFPAGWVWLCAEKGPSGGQPPTWASRTGHALFCAVAWVAMEMIVARMFTGFPWNLLGASQQKLLPLIQVASFTGVYGVAFLVVWFAASLLHTLDALLEQPTARHVWLQTAALPILIVAANYAWGASRITSAPKAARTLRLALVQPSIPQTMIWNPSDSEARFADLLRLSQAALTNRPDVVIWPEAAVPKMVRDDETTARTIAELARAHRAWFILGSDDFELRGTNAVYFNSSFLVSPRGEFANTSYRKRRLVIFGEYVPLAESIPLIKYLTPISGGFTPGRAPETFVLEDLNVKTSVLICFEDVFPHYAREHAVDGVDFLVNITNDGWFGESAAQWQHAANAALRAVENGMPLVRCANNGVSCWIDTFGAFHNEYYEGTGDTYGPGFKIVEVPLPSRDAKGGRTFYNRHGDWFGWTCVGLTAVPLGTRLMRMRRARKEAT